MEETTKVMVVIGSAVLMSLIGYLVKGVFWAFMGFALTILIIYIFIIWKRYSNMD